MFDFDRAAAANKCQTAVSTALNGGELRKCLHQMLHSDRAAAANRRQTAVSTALNSGELRKCLHRILLGIIFNIALLMEFGMLQNMDGTFIFFCIFTLNFPVVK